MKRVLKDHFIPHEGNAYQPFLLRHKSTLAILALVLFLEAVYVLSTFVILPKSANFAAVFAGVLVEQTNKERATDLKLPTLRTSPKLELAAKMKAEDMASKGYFSHNSPDGKTPWYWFKEAGYDYAAAGENLAVNFTDSKDITEAWMRSPTHRANIMNGNYTEIGIATAEGAYKGKPAIFVVQEFGRPSIVARQIDTSTSTASALSNAITGSVAGVSDVLSEKIAIAQKPTQPTLVAEREAPVIPSTTTVAGVDTKQLDIPESTFTETVTEPIFAPVTSPIAEIAPTPSKVATIVASPRRTTTTIFLVIAGILTLALGLTIFIKIRVQYPHIIANGVLLLAVIVALIILNTALGFSRGMI